MVGVFINENWHDSFPSLTAAESYVNDMIENLGYKQEQFSYTFY